MFNSVFGKWLLTYLAIAMISILLSSLIVGYWSRENTLQHYEETLFSKAERIHQLFLDQAAGTITNNEVQQQVRFISQNLDINAVLIYQKQGLNEIGKEYPSFNPTFLKSIIYGKQRAAETFIDQQEQRQMVVAGLPVDDGKTGLSAILLSSPYQNIQSMVKTLYRILFLTSAVISLLVIGMLFFASRWLTRPIVAMSRIANQMAIGNFSEKMELKGKDEIYMLASSFNRMAKQLGRVEQTRKQFISEISHELRTPLTTIRVSLQGLLEQIYEKEEEKEILKISLLETKRLSKLVEDLLELAAFEEKQVKLYKRNADLLEVLRQTVTQMNLKARAKGIEIILTSLWKEQAIAAVHADTDRLRQVLINLLDNAIAYSDPGHNIDVVLEKKPREWIISVRDKGRGIEAEKIQHIFDRFFKADDSRSEYGAGLGLTISKYIIAAHDGEISVESRLGEGTTFTIQLQRIGVEPNG